MQMCVPQLLHQISPYPFWAPCPTSELPRPLITCSTVGKLCVMFDKLHLTFNFKSKASSDVFKKKKNKQQQQQHECLLQMHFNLSCHL